MEKTGTAQNAWIMVMMRTMTINLTIALAGLNFAKEVSHDNSCVGPCNLFNHIGSLLATSLVRTGKGNKLQGDNG